ncbi:MAG: tetratricopeptide repeat protein [Bacteroidales bacterium]
MKSPILSVLLFISVSLTIFAGETDSLEQLLPSLQGIEKADMLIKLTRKFAVDSKEKSLRYGNEALELSKKINYDKGEATALIALSTAHYSSSDYNKAIEYLKDAYIIIEELKDSSLLLNTLNKLSINYRLTGNYKESLSTSLRALQIAEQQNDTVSCARFYNNIGGVYKELKEFDKALDYYVHAYNIYSRLNDLSGLAQTTNNIGIIHRMNQNYDTALIYYNKSLYFEQQLNNKRGIAQSLNNIGNLYFLIGDYKKAIESFHTSLSISQETGNIESQTVSWNFLGNVYSKLGNFNESTEAYNKMLSLSNQTGNKNRLSMAVEQLAKIYTQTGDLKKAIEYYEKLTALRDSLYQEQINVIVTEIEAKYELENQAKEIENLRQKTKIQELRLNAHRFIIYALIILSLISVFIAFLVTQRNKLRIAKKNAELEQKLFRLQMNPHFMFNALNTIQSFIITNNTDDAIKYLSNFAKLMRQVLNNSRQDLISLANEINAMEYYMQLQQLRYDNKFVYNIFVGPKLHPELIMIPPMLAQPFIENSIEHGFQGLKHQGKINISFNLNHDSIIFEIKDNGIGITQALKNKSAEMPDHDSIAMDITLERIRLLNQNKKHKIEFQVKELLSQDMMAEGTVVSFSIPLRTQDNINLLTDKYLAK